MAEDYADKSERTLRRDIKALEKLDLVEVVDGTVRAKIKTILAFLPDRREL